MDQVFGYYQANTDRRHLIRLNFALIFDDFKIMSVEITYYR